jgi:DNA-binding NtrC family response regulator
LKTISKKFSDNALEAMMKYNWKGNVRELKNTVERLLVTVDSDTIEKKDLPEVISGETQIYLPDVKKVKSLKDFRDLAEKEFILSKLEENDWNISQTAREIDTPRSNLYKKLEQYGIKIKAGVGEVVASTSLDREGGGKSELHRAGWSLTATLSNRRKVPQKTYRSAIGLGLSAE